MRRILKIPITTITITTITTITTDAISPLSQSPLSQHHHYHNITTITISPLSQYHITTTTISPLSQFHHYHNHHYHNHHYHYHHYHNHHNRRDFTAKRSHSTEKESLARKLCFHIFHFHFLKDVSQESLGFTFSIVTFAGMSRTKASFSHLPLSDFEGSLAGKLRFHIFHFHFWRDVSHESVGFTSSTFRL